MSKKKNLENLIEILENSNINSLEVSSFWGFKKVRLSKGGFRVSENLNSRSSFVEPKLDSRADISSESLDNSDRSQQTFDDKVPDNLLIQEAPLVGTAYLSPKPEEPPFIKVGDVIKKGQKICLIEAMKIFNEIEAEHDGTVYEILIENEGPVEFGQPIIKIKP